MNRQLSFVLGSIFCLFAAQTYVFVLIPLAAAEQRLPGIFIGVLVGVSAGIGLVSDVLVAVISDAIGRRGPMIAGAACGVLSGILFALGSDFPTLLTGAVVFGLAMSLAIGPALAYVTEASTPKDHARVQGYNGAVQGMSALAGALLVGFAVDHFGARASALLGSVLMGAALILSYQLGETVQRMPAPRTPRRLAGAYVSAARMLVTRPPLQLASLVSLLYGSVVFVIGNAFVPLYIVRDLGQSAILAGVLLGGRNLAMTLVSPFFGRIVERHGLLATMFGACIVAEVGVVLTAVSGSPAFLFAALVLQGAGIGFTPAISNILVTSATERRERALGFATNSLAARGGSLISPLIFGAILQVADMHAVFVAGGLLGGVYLVAMAGRIVSSGGAILPIHGGVAVTDDRLR